MRQPGAPVIVVARRVRLVRVKPAQQTFKTGDLSVDLGEDEGQLAFDLPLATSINSRHARSYIQGPRGAPFSRAVDEPRGMKEVPVQTPYC